MNFLIDNAISPTLSNSLIAKGHNSIHVRDVGLQNANDILIFERAFNENRIIISADTDFGFLLSQWKYNKPSAIIFRKGANRDPVKQSELLNHYLYNKEFTEALSNGSIIIIEINRIRIKTLPFYKV